MAQQLPLEAYNTAAEHSRILAKASRGKNNPFVEQPVSTPTASFDSPFYHSELSVKHSARTAALNALWPYPQTELERNAYTAFKFFMRHQFFMSSGLKFGGDHLLYQREYYDCDY